MKIKLDIYQGESNYVYHKEYDEYEIIEAIKFKLFADGVIGFGDTYEVEIASVEV